VAPPTTIAAATPLVTLQTIVTDFLRWLGFSPPTFNWQFPVLNFFQSIWTGLQQLFQWSPAPAPPPPSTSTGTEPELLWESNFSDMDDALSSWTVQTGRWGASAGENQYYTSGTSNAYLDQNGNLVIEARQETPPDGMGAPFDYTSARVVTYGNQSFEPPVRITARIKMPYTQGILPAFWTVGLKPGHEFDWPDQGEIDIVELPGVNSPDQSSSWTGNIHGPAEADGAVDGELTGIDADIGVDLSADFHEYGIDWYPDHITWHVDGAEVGTITQAEYEAMGGDWTPFSGAWPHYLILTLAVGNPWTGDPDASSTFPQQMLVDWVRVWSLTPELTTAV
jgi:beta-glucanase (GH16 family)